MLCGTLCALRTLTHLFSRQRLCLERSPDIWWPCSSSILFGEVEASDGKSSGVRGSGGAAHAKVLVPVPIVCRNSIPASLGQWIKRRRNGGRKKWKWLLRVRVEIVMRGNVHIGSVKKRPLGTYIWKRERERRYFCAWHTYYMEAYAWSSRALTKTKQNKKNDVAESRPHWHIFQWCGVAPDSWLYSLFLCRCNLSLHEY